MTTAVPSSKANPNTPMPRAAGRAEPGGGSGPAPVRTVNARLLQQILSVVGAILLPTGLVVIVLGWYGAAKTPYQYDQLSYVVSGGLLGLGLTFAGGFLYFGSWMARLATDQRETSARLAETLAILASGVSPGAPSATDKHDVHVIVGSGTTVHRADCDLIAGRDDLHPLGNDRSGLTACRICRPEAGL